MPKAVFFFLGLFIICSLLIGTYRVYAQTDFSTQVDTVYVFSSLDNRTQVKQTFSITNQTAETFITEYAIEIGSTSIENLHISIPNQPRVEVSQTQTDNTTIINFEVPDPIVGKDQVLQIELTYQTADLVLKKGNVVEISIPNIVKQNDEITYTSTVVVPKDLGSPSAMTPQPDRVDQKSGTIEYFFNAVKGGSAITAIFGEYQGVSFVLSYRLQNSTSNEGLVQVAFPPDTPYQKLHYELIEPPPRSLQSDEDGNWLGTYHLKPNQHLDVVAKGQATLYLHPVVQVPQDEPTEEMLKEVKPFWPVNDPKIREIAQNLHSPKEVYDYVVNTFTYNYDRVGTTNQRLGALEALNAPDNALCQEFTDTFITLARAAGIPAREINGYAYTQNTTLRPLSLVPETLHAWPEYYDYESKQWIPVDPTWEHTTGGSDYFNLWDYNHFVFVVHGKDAVKPYPPGYYQPDGSIQKDIAITYTENQALVSPNISFNIQQNPFSTFGLPFKSTVSATNLTGSAVYNVPVTLHSESVNVPESIVIDQLLPFSGHSQLVRLQPKSLFSNNNLTLSLTTYGQETKYQLKKIQDFGLYFFSIILAVGGISTAGAFIARRLLVSVKRK